MQERRTLDELDPPAWGPPDDDSTHLVMQCHALRKKPVADFTVEDLRIMIGQQVSLPHLIPRAITVLEASPLAEGDYYPGDLLNAVVTISEDYWRAHHDQWLTVWGIADRLNRAFEHLREPIARFSSIGF